MKNIYAILMILWLLWAMINFPGAKPSDDLFFWILGAVSGIFTAVYFCDITNRKK